MANCLDLYRELGVEPRYIGKTAGRGEEWQGPCPCDTSSKDRFHIFPDQKSGYGSFWCRKCGRVGGTIDFLVHFRGMSRDEACRHLGIALRHKGGAKKGLFIPPKRVFSRFYTPQSIDQTTVADFGAWQQHACKFVLLANEHLLSAETDRARGGVAWLLGRGVSRVAIEEFLLGLHETPGRKPAYRQRSAWGIEQQAGESGVFVLPHGIVIPKLSGGRVVGLRIRRSPADIDEHNPKYHQVKGSRHATMYLPSTQHRCDTVVVVESELDALAIWSAARDLVSAMALGSLAAKPDADAWQHIAQARLVLLCLDRDLDASGELTEGVQRAQAWWQQQLSATGKLKVVSSPYGKDIGEAVQAGQDLRAWICSHDPVCRWRGLQVSASASSHEDEPAAVSIADGSVLAQALSSATLAEQIITWLRRIPAKLVVRHGCYRIMVTTHNGSPRDWDSFSRLSELLFERRYDLWGVMLEHLTEGVYSADSLLRPARN